EAALHEVARRLQVALPSHLRTAGRRAGASVIDDDERERAVALRLEHRDDHVDACGRNLHDAFVQVRSKLLCGKRRRKSERQSGCGQEGANTSYHATPRPNCLTRPGYGGRASSAANRRENAACPLLLVIGSSTSRMRCTHGRPIAA